MSDEQPLSVWYKLYVPAAARVTLVIDGFCKVELNPFGPNQFQPAAPFPEPSKLSVCSVHTGLGLA